MGLSKKITARAYIVIAAVIGISGVAPLRASAACAVPVTVSSAASSATTTAYADWKKTYVVSAGDSLRVQRSAGDGYDTVSEGIAYGMLFSAYGNDKTTFDGLWRYAKNHMNANGVMNWRIAADGSTIGWNGATDADEDMAAALIAADSRWGGYKNDATSLINTIKKYEVEPGTNILKPGDAWGGSDLLNPSYLTPSYYSVFASYTGDSSWNDVRTASYKVFDAIAANTPSKTSGLIPDWSRADGYRAGGMGYDYGYDGSRAPLRLAMAANWDCDAKAAGFLTTLNTANMARDLANLRSSYALDGTATGTGDGTPLLAAAAVGATVSDDPSFRDRTWSALISAPSSGYFGDSMRLFGLYVAGGTLSNPLSLSKTAPVVDTSVPAAPKAYAMVAQSATVTTGSPTTITVNVSAPMNRTNMLVDLEVYDTDGTRLAQRFSENVTLSPGGSSYSVSFTPPSDGSYTIRGGIFTSGWASNLLWNGSIATMIATSPAPVQQPTIPSQLAPITPTAPESTTVQPAPTPAAPVTSVLPTITSLSIWWPGTTQAVSGVQPFKAVLDDTPLSQYSMYWQVDGGTLNPMSDSNEGALHKLSLVDLKYWTWRGDNKYTITFVAKNGAGSVITQKSVIITVAR